LFDSCDARQSAPATQRNREPILAVLQEVLPPTGTVLEVSSGTGEHAVFFAPRLQPRQWIPSDPNPVARASIAAWQDQDPIENLHPPLDLDASAPVWAVEAPPPEPLQTFDFQRYPIMAIVNINMIHIAPWSACLGLMAGARRILPPGGILYLYGPFKQQGQHTAPSNAAFDQSLRAQDPAWGVRDLEAVVAAAQAQDLAWVKTVAMPANNLSVIFRA
jgi:SAM-dependent methyltransferase